jgi:saccharopine dehydrogenase (NAD+, L-glutamate forming)
MLTGVGFKGWLRGLTLSLGLAGFVVAMMIGPLRRLMQKSLLPKPGEGPSETQQQNGYYDLRVVGQNEQQQMAIKVTGDRDPGYGSTAKMLAQAGLCMALDVEKTDLPGGFWTPSTAMGDKLVTRLIQHAGLEFEVIE